MIPSASALSPVHNATDKPDAGPLFNLLTISITAVSNAVLVMSLLLNGVLIVCLVKSRKACDKTVAVLPSPPLTEAVVPTGAQMSYTDLELKDVTQQGEYQTCDVVESANETYASVDEKAQWSNDQDDGYLVPDPEVDHGKAPSSYKLKTDQANYLVPDPCHYEVPEIE